MKLIVSAFLIFLYATGLLHASGCSNSQQPAAPAPPQNNQIITGAERMNEYASYLRGKKVGVVVNQTSMVGYKHLVDTLLSERIAVVKIFSPEHGFRGSADAGEKVDDETDSQTGLPVISLYGSHRKPAREDMKGLDVVLFDLQDVGARFYTYISTMHYVMEACAENDVELIVLDRPNPNGHYVDGPVLDTAFRSFIGMHPVPVVHGMTVAEYARMINGEGWLANGGQCQLKYVICANYDHTKKYRLPVKPSPNLPDMKSVYLYPSTCFFEGTMMSVGRGTKIPFQIYGHPDYPAGSYSFVPKSRPGAKNPKFEGQKCNGVKVFSDDEEQIGEINELHLEFIADAYIKMGKPESFFTPFFNKLAGTDLIMEAIRQGTHPLKISDLWIQDVQAFKQIRKKYLLYKDFE